MCDDFVDDLDDVDFEMALALGLAIGEEIGEEERYHRRVRQLSEDEMDTIYEKNENE